MAVLPILLLHAMPLHAAPQHIRTSSPCSIWLLNSVAPRSSVFSYFFMLFSVMRSVQEGGMAGHGIVAWWI